MEKFREFRLKDLKKKDKILNKAADKKKFTTNIADQ
jgi:hypothetical protein